MTDSMNKRKISLCDIKDCLGCLACYNICPNNAIRLYTSRTKTIYPSIDSNVCISCGQCRKVCPVIYPVLGNEPLEGFACYTKNEYDVKTCSSGGVATTLYRSVLDDGGVIVGAVEQGTKAPLLHVTEDKKHIENFKGSKYVYVEPKYVYRKIEEKLKNNKKVLFVGTPCQVDALNHYLAIQYENLYTVDIICHGTPPFEYLHEYIEYILKNRAHVTSYSFRGQHDFYFTVYVNDKIIYKRKNDEDTYFVSFLDGLIHREICYKCPYAQKRRMSDMTIGDYWGADNNVLGGYKGKISAVIINTKKGKDLWNAASERFISEKAEIDRIINGNSQLRNPSTRHSERDIFITELSKTGSFISAINKTSIPLKVRKNRIINRLKKIPKAIIQRIIPNLN